MSIQNKKDKDEEYYSMSDKLKSENKTSEEFEIMLSALTIEEVIGLRLELAARSLNSKLYGFKLWENIPKIAREAVLLYAVTAAKTKGEAASFLGITKNELFKNIKKFNIKNYLFK
tara:strand:- start:274 stop:621 length:348 start_codon:yes stop_codon:yes gene_type:complete